MTNQNFQVGDRVFDDVKLEHGIVCDETKIFVRVRFKIAYSQRYYKDGKFKKFDARPRLHSSNPSQEIFEKINEAFNKGEKE